MLDLLNTYAVWLNLLLKMLLIMGALAWLNRSHLSASNKALIWRLGLVLMLVTPFVGEHLHLWSLPILASDSIGPETVKALPPALMAGQQPVDSGFGLKVWLVIGMLGSVLLLIKMAHSLYRLHRITQVARPVTSDRINAMVKQLSQQLPLTPTPQVLLTEAVVSPCTWGKFKPVILLPINADTGDMHDNTLKMALLHEMLHIKRQDWCWMVWGKAMTAVFWFNPMMWWIQRNMMTSFEAACDEAVLAHQVSPSSYAQSLLHFHQQQHNHLNMATAMARQSLMFQRLNQILTPHNRSQTMNPKKQKLMLFSAFVGMSLIALSQITHAEIEQTPTAELPTSPAANAPAAKPEAPDPVVAADVPSTPAQPSPARVPPPKVVPSPASQPTAPVVAPTPPVPATKAQPAMPAKPSPETEVVPEGEVASVPEMAAAIPEPFSRLLAHESTHAQAKSLVQAERRQQRLEKQALREQVQTLRQQQRQLQHQQLSKSLAKTQEHQRRLATVQQRAQLRQLEAKQAITAVRDEQRQRVNNLRQSAQQAIQKAWLVREQAHNQKQQRQQNQ